jgi:transcriptional regulatory protein RtcR
MNCATLRGDAAMSTLFGHIKGAFTGALAERAGLLRKADGGVLFLDEVGELGIDEQAMLLRAIEEGVFYPMGSDKEARSQFQLIAGTNRDLDDCVRKGTFREDLLARINLWTFKLPALHERPEDLEPNLDYELARLEGGTTMNREAREAYLQFARNYAWPGNFRDLNASVVRMGTLAGSGRISAELVQREVLRLSSKRDSSAHDADSPSAALLAGRALDLFDQVQLDAVLRICKTAKTASEAGRVLFAASRADKSSANDTDRLKKYLARFGLNFADTKQ